MLREKRKFRILHPAKISLKNKKEINTFVDFKKVLEEIIMGRLAQRERLKDILQAERK